MLTNERKRKIIFDCVLVAVLLIIGISVFLFINCERTHGRIVVVTVDNEFYDEYSLFESGEYPIGDGSNILVIEKGRAYMDKICVKKGEIFYIGEDITCLPNRVRVEVTD